MPFIFVLNQIVRCHLAQLTGTSVNTLDADSLSANIVIKSQFSLRMDGTRRKVETE